VRVEAAPTRELEEEQIEVTKEDEDIARRALAERMTAMSIRNALHRLNPSPMGPTTTVMTAT
jgi:hypothetical protein